MTGPNRNRRRIARLSDLSRIERLLLEHVERYRMTTRCGWRGAWELADFDAERLSRSVRKLTLAKLLRRGTLYGSIHYFELSPAGAELLQLLPVRGRPLSDRARYRAFAQLLFATTGAQRRQLMRASELITCNCTAAPDIEHEPTRLPWGIFRDIDVVGRLSVLLVDRSAKTKVRHLGQRLRESIVRLSRHPQIASRIAAGACAFAVITPSVRRGQQIAHRVARYDEIQSVNFSLMVAPGLLPLWKQHHSLKEDG